MACLLVRVRLLVLMVVVDMLVVVVEVVVVVVVVRGEERIDEVSVHVLSAASASACCDWLLTPRRRPFALSVWRAKDYKPAHLPFSRDAFLTISDGWGKGADLCLLRRVSKYLKRLQRLEPEDSASVESGS